MRHNKKNMKNFSSKIKAQNQSNITMYRNHGASQIKTVYKDLKDELHSPDFDIGNVKKY